MKTDIYQHLCKTLAKRGGRYPGIDVLEFYALMRELFTPQEAEIYCAIPRGFNPPSRIAKAMDKPEDEVTAILETMADKDLCTAGTFENSTFYGAPRLVPGIFECQFMRGTSTDKDRKLAKLIHAYKAAVDKIQGPPKVTLAMGTQDLLQVNLDRCIGCVVCASSCPEDAIALETRADIEAPPADRKALRAAIKATGTQGIY